MSLTVRAFENETRIATAVPLGNGSYLQVYPSKETFESLQAWKSKYPFALFREERPKQKQERKLARWVENELKYNLYEPVQGETEFQATVRLLYFQRGLPDSISSKKKEVKNYYDVLRRDSGLHVFYAGAEKITPVYFNRKTGLVALGTRGDDLPTSSVGMMFFVRQYDDLYRVEPMRQGTPEGKPIVVYHTKRWYSMEDMRRIQMLMNTGHYVQFFTGKYRLAHELVKAFYARPGVKGVLETSTDSWESVEIYQTNSYVPLRMQLSKWLEKK